MGRNQYKIQRSLRRAELIRYWLPALIWSAVLLILSGRAGSSSITIAVLSWIFPPSNPAFEEVHFGLRKLIHLLAYGLLGYLDFRAVRGPRTGWKLRWSAIALTLVVVIASLDEWHQTYVPGRTGQVRDVGLDFAGAALAQVVIRAISVAPSHRFS